MSSILSFNVNVKYVSGDWQRAWEGIRTASHAEIKAVIAMRATGKSHGTIAINNPAGPCAGTPITCEELLGHFLKKAQTMTVYWPDGHHLIVKGKG